VDHRTRGESVLGEAIETGALIPEPGNAILRGPLPGRSRFAGLSQDLNLESGFAFEALKVKRRDGQAQDIKASGQDAGMLTKNTVNKAEGYGR
jgi:hypothetical protein